MGQVASPHRSFGEKWTRQAYVIEENINPQIVKSRDKWRPTYVIYPPSEEGQEEGHYSGTDGLQEPPITAIRSDEISALITFLM